MRKVAVLTDSACDISLELQQKYGIDILPFLHCGGRKKLPPSGGFYQRKNITEMRAKCERHSRHIPDHAMRFLDGCPLRRTGIHGRSVSAISSTGSIPIERGFASRQYREEHPDSQLKFSLWTATPTP